MLNDKMLEMLNNQVNAEMASGYLYLSMATYFEQQDLPGFANSLRVHAQEELEHAMRFYDYIIRKGGRVTLLAIEEPKNEWNSTLEVYEEILAHEELVTSLINDIADLAIKLKDHATNQFIQWFIEEQVEEEELAHEDLRKVKLAQQSTQVLYMLDKEYGEMIFTSENDE